MFLDKLLDLTKSVYVILVIVLLIVVLYWAIKIYRICKKNNAERKHKEALERDFQASNPDLHKFQYHPRTTDFVASISFKCPTCGATVPSKNIDGKLSVYCIYCGSRLPEAEKYIDMQIEDHQKRMDYEMHMSAKQQEMNREEKHEFHKTLMQYFPMILFIIFMIFLFIFLGIKTSGRY